MQDAIDSATGAAIGKPEIITSPERIAALHAIRDRLPGSEGRTQQQRLLVALRELGHITTFEASRYLDIYDPRARKMGLLRAGHDVITYWRQVLTEAGRLHRIGVYVLARAGVTA